MIPQQWTSPCGNQCTHKYATLMQIPCCWYKQGRGRFHVRNFPLFSQRGCFQGRVFCKKGCDADGETWEECLTECNEICYKDPVLKDQQWSAYIDRSPGAANYSEECFHACVAGCGYKFEMCREKVDQVRPNRPLLSKPPPEEKPQNPTATKPNEPAEDVPSTSA